MVVVFAVLAVVVVVAVGSVLGTPAVAVGSVPELKRITSRKMQKTRENFHTIKLFVSIFLPNLFQ